MDVPSFHTIEKENEVVFYIPYEKELTRLYTNEFFALHNQDAEVSIIAFHNNDSIVKGGAIMDFVSPYTLFSDKAKSIEDKLKNTFQQVPSSESSYSLFSSLINNAKNMFSSSTMSESSSPTMSSTMSSTMSGPSSESPSPTSSSTSSIPLSEGYIFQIIIQKKPSKPLRDVHLKIPLDVLLEREIDYYHEKIPDRHIQHKYVLHGIYMIA